MYIHVHSLRTGFFLQHKKKKKPGACCESIYKHFLEFHFFLHSIHTTLCTKIKGMSVQCTSKLKFFFFILNVTDTHLRTVLYFRMVQSKVSSAEEVCPE